MKGRKAQRPKTKRELKSRELRWHRQCPDRTGPQRPRCPGEGEQEKGLERMSGKESALHTELGFPKGCNLPEKAD